MGLADLMATRVGELLDVLDDDQRAATTRPFGSAERLEWAYWPRERPGVPLHELGRAATKAVQRLLATGLPAPAFARAVTIMGLDEVLDRAEAYAGDRRHRDDYSVVVFGRPGDDAWGWRFEGHHVSVHATLAGEDVHLAPLFLGANPAVVRDEDGRTVVAPLAVEERLGFDLLHALTTEQRADATLAESAPRDIASRNDPRVDRSLVGAGVPLSALQGDAARAAAALVDVYLRRVPDGAARPDPSGAHFGWAGAGEPGTGHYYRVGGPGLLVELDNTQDGANHVHTVVRDPERDFGGDALAAHHRHAH